MEHVSNETLGALRAGTIVSARDYAHVDRCVGCRTALGVPIPPPPRRSPARAFVAVASICALVAAIGTIAPLRAAAFGFVEIFEPQQLAFVPMSADELRAIGAMPDFGDFGTSSEIRASRSIEARSLGQAQAIAGYRLREPADAAAFGRAAYDVTTPGLEQFVFDENKARAYATTKRAPWVPMPVGMNGAMVRLAFGSAVTTHFGDAFVQPLAHPCVRSDFVNGRTPRSVASTCRTGATVVFGSSRRGHRVSDSNDVFFAQMPVPKLGSTGVSMRAIEQYLVDRPGVPPRLAAAFAALRDPTTTIPIPIPIDRRYARPVLVDGVWGTSIGDDTGLGSGVMWERNGFVYALGGMRTTREIVAIANTLQ